MKNVERSDTSTATFFHRLTTQPPETLPILQQSCLQVLNRTSDNHSNASDISEVIMHDQALLANIIKIANSPAYQTLSQVKTPTHAVTIIRFDVIRSIVVASQLVEQAQQFEVDTECIKCLLTRSLLAATEAIELLNAIGFKVEGLLFTNAMLYTLGDLVLAICQPEVFQQLGQERGKNRDEMDKIEIELLGRPLHSLASTVAKHWRLPDTLVLLLEKNLVLGNYRQETQQAKLEGLVFFSE